MKSSVRTLLETASPGEGGTERQQPATIPCFRCGVCCERWQPLIDLDRARRIASWLGKLLLRFLDEHTEVYPLHDEQVLIRRAESGACSFLERESDGLTRCGIHPVRPDACRDWEAGLLRKECRSGLARIGDGKTLLPLSELYGGPEDRKAAVQAIAR
jgi:Fe-S-cluster containining protein